MKRVLLTLLISLALTPLAYGKDEMKAKVDSLRGTVGAAVGAQRSTVRGGRVQEFEKGAIYWSPKTGARFVKSDALAKYKSLGAEKGKLGFPVSDERPVSKGGMRQTFEHGFLRTTAAGDLTADILSGVTLSADTLTISPSSGVLLGIDDGFLNVRDVSGPDIQLSCSCEANPSPTSQRLGICNLTISKSRKTATCRNRDCNGSCVFETSQK
jgi:uncharacterized protein with LGFP repeats